MQTGAPITYVSQQPGHRDASITLRVYAHWLPDVSRRVDRLDPLQPDATPAQPEAVPTTNRPSVSRLFWIILPVERIDWADAARNYVDVHAAGEIYTVRTTLEQLVRQLDPDQFVRVNRSQLVNLDSVKEMHPWFHGERLIVLKDGRELTWTRRFRAGRAASSLRQTRSSR